jgi:hypothetical protein
MPLQALHDGAGAIARFERAGSFTPAMRESDEDVVRERRLVADTLRFAVDTRGDYANSPLLPRA